MKNWPIRGQTDTWAHKVSYWQEKWERAMLKQDRRDSQDNYQFIVRIIKTNYYRSIR